MRLILQFLLLRTGAQHGRRRPPDGRWRRKGGGEISVMSKTRKPILAALAFMALLAAWVGWREACDPLAFIARPPPAYRVVRDEAYPMEKNGEQRLYRDLVFAAEGQAPIRITLSLPAFLPAPRMPVMIILGGLRSGRRSLRSVPRLGANVAVGFEYPYKEEIRDEESPALARIAAVRSAAVETPGQLVTVIRWLRAQPWADPRRISLLGYSLGAVLVPASHRKAAAQGYPLGPSIMAFGGADLGRIVPNVLHLDSAAARWGAGLIANALLRPVEPAFHLPHLKGDFLLISAEEDELVPPASSLLMQTLTPEPKTIVNLPGAHIGPRDPAVLARTINVSRRWLTARGASNP